MHLHITLPFIILFLCGAVKSDNDEHTESIIPGGVSSHDQPATQDIINLVEEIHPEIRAHLLGLPGGRNIRGDVVAISFRTQLVNGVNYFIKVRARTPKKMIFYHLKVFKSFGGSPQLIRIEGPKKQDDEIGYF